MGRRIVIAEDVRAIEADGEIVIPPDAILTEAARELAQERGISIRVDGTGAESGASGVISREQGGSGQRTKAARAIAIGSDHGGYELKEYLKRFLTDSRYEVRDLGTNSTEAVDYPDFARAVAREVAAGTAWRGIVVDAAGIGSAIAANKIAGVRAALCYDRATARNSRQHNDANVLTLGARLLPPEQAREIAAVWLETEFGGGRHQRRVDKIVALETGAAGIQQHAVPAPPEADDDHKKLVESITKEVLCYLGDKQMCELRGLEIDEVVCPGCDGRCVENCPNKAQRVVAAGADRLTAGPGISQIPAEIARVIDHTLLKPEASQADIQKLCQEARQFGFASVCVNPTWVAVCAAALQGSPVKVCTVAGFPLGATLTKVKVLEAEQAVQQGAEEVDMVMNVGALKSGQYERVEQDIRAVTEASHEGGAICKVILECALLTDQEKVIASRLAQSAGADFVKTSTGFGPGGATAHDVELMRLVVGPQMGVKAAGGIRSYEDLQKMLAAGATRIGASASVKILQEATAK